MNEVKHTVDNTLLNMINQYKISSHEIKMFPRSTPDIDNLFL